jgi:capsular polysaccharide biosynthesis protein
MELKRLLEMFLRRWPLILVSFALLTGLTFWWVESKPDSYRAAGTYVVRPRLDPSGQIDVRAIEALIKGVEIPATYASIARSDVIRERAKDVLGERENDAGLRVGAEVVTGTNTVEISAHANDPRTAREFALAVGTATSEYIDDLRDTYRLELLDAPRIPASPVDVKRNLTVVIGAVLGVVLGFTLAFVMENFGIAWRATRSGRPRTRKAEAQPSAPPREPTETDPRAPVPAGNGASVEPRLTDATTPLDLAGSESSVSPDFQRALDAASQSGDVHSLGVLKFNGSNGGQSNGSKPHPGLDRERVEKLLHTWAQQSGGTFTYVDNETFAVRLPGVTAPAASRLLANWCEMLLTFELQTDEDFEIAIDVREYGRRTTGSLAPSGKGPVA